jgi:hypothetical protein
LVSAVAIRDAASRLSDRLCTASSRAGSRFSRRANVITDASTSPSCARTQEVVVGLASSWCSLRASTSPSRRSSTASS